MKTKNNKIRLSLNKIKIQRNEAFKKDIMLKGSTLFYNYALQEEYDNKIQKLVTQMTREVTKEIIKFFQSPLCRSFFDQQDEVMALDTSERNYTSLIYKARKEYDKKNNPKDNTKKTAKTSGNVGSQAKILMNQLESKFDQLFASKSKKLANDMLNTTEKVSKSNLHASLKKLTGGLSLKTGIVPRGMNDIMAALVADNVSYIKSIPEEYFKNVTGAVMRSITNGEGLASLVPDIEKTIRNADRAAGKIPRKKNDGKLDDYNRQVKRRSNNIAMDQSRKAYSSINQQRLANAGVKKFEWIHSFSGSHPRKSHIKIDGEIFSFDNVIKEQADLGVPEQDRGMPGVPPYCRCVFKPVIDFDEL